MDEGSETLFVMLSLKEVSNGDDAVGGEKLEEDLLEALCGRRVDSEGFPEVTRIVGDERGQGAISRDDEFVEVDDGVG